MVAEIARLFRGDAAVAEGQVALVDDQLFPEELDYIRRAVPKRRAEFGTARICARRALAALGAREVALVPRSDRAPAWPPGVVGSITHCDDYCAVVVHRAPPALSVGLDAERLRRLDPEIIELVVTPRERRWLREQADPMGLAILLFSAKEAYYKCQYPLSGALLDFQDVELEVDLAATIPAAAAHLTGRFASGPDRVTCGVELFA
jgi:4'-phosphopantetheinyl transferase EntD